MQPTTPRKALLSTIAALGLVGGLFVPAAGAKGKDEAPGQAKKADAAQVDRDGDADRNPGTAYTEDDDTNDGGTPNNVADSGDNRHPSGKDRSVEHGKSGNQGKAESDPDNNGKGPERNTGGPDKPNGSGGIDKADQDGNNGCGNDDDFEDDSEGWCGRKPKAAKPAPPAADKPKADKPANEHPGKPAESPKPDTKPNKPDTKPDTPKGGDTGAPGKSDSKPCPKGGGKMGEGHGKGCGHSCTKGGGHTKGKGKGHTESCPAAPATQQPCPTGMVDTNGSMPGGCAAPGCPSGQVDTNGSMPGGCVVPGAAEAPCPAGTTDTNGTMPGGCVTPDGDVLGSGGTTTAAPAAAEDDDDTDAEGTDAPEVSPNTAERPATVSAAAAGTAAVASGSGELFSVGSLAFTGASTLVLLAVAFGLLGLGFVLVQASRRRAEATR